MSITRTLFQRKSIIGILALALIMGIVGIGLNLNVAAAGTGPCDIYGAAGNTCVAAHSTVRALYGAYSGNLYQVRRASDNATQNIGVLAAGGFANAATQDSFCSGTTCVTTVLYDQSGHGNDMWYQGSTQVPGSSVSIPANANKEWLTVSGNKVYALNTDPHVSYWRDGHTTGMPTGTQPEGMYMVTSGTHYNSGCCFDYGNSETTRMADAAGAMDAIYFGSSCWFGGCSGTGPWVQADLEWGLFPGGSSSWNPSQVAWTNQYVTAMLKNNGTTLMAIKGGNAQSGSLTTMYSGTLPSGYNPMKKQGAIVLGSGGDCCKPGGGANDSAGTFYEGAIVTGYPSDATDNAVQANIVAALYGGGGGPTATPAPINPYNQVEAETFTSKSGAVQAETCGEGGQNLGYIATGDYVVYNNVEFGATSPTSFQARIAGTSTSGKIDIRLDSPTGTLVGTLNGVNTGGWQTYTTASTTVSGATGTHNLYLVFTAGLNLNWFKFIAGGGPTPTRTNTPVGPTPTRTPTSTPGGSTQYEAESAALAGGTCTATNHTGYTGSGFVACYDTTTTGRSTTFTVNAASAGSKTVTLRYSAGPNGPTTDRTLSVYVNGVKIRQTVMVRTSTWDTWATKAETLTLNAGSNTIKYQFDSGDTGWVNLDNIIVQ